MEFNWIPLIIGIVLIFGILLIIGLGEFWYYASNGEPGGFVAFAVSIALLVTVPLGFILT